MNFDPDPYLHSSNYFRPISEIYDPNSDLSKLADQFKLLSIGSDDPNPEFEIDHISQAETLNMHRQNVLKIELSVFKGNVVWLFW